MIDDALKRAQAAGQPDADASGPQGDRPWVPAPLPDAGLARRGRLARILTAVLCVFAAAAAGVWFLRRAPAESARLPARAAPVPMSAAVTAPPVAAPEPVVSAPPAAAAASVARPRPTRPPAPTGDDPGAASASDEIPAPDPPAPRAQSLADGKTYAGSVLLPGGAKIELGGIVWSEAEPRALLNDRIAGLGAWVEGFTVAKIEPERVALEKDGLTIFLSLK